LSRIRDIVTCAVLLAMPLLFLRANVREPSRAGPFDRAILLLSAPIQRVATQFAEGARSIWTDYVFLIHLRGENERLRRENVVLRAEAQQARRAAERGARYEKLLGLRAETPSETLAARVIARETSPFFRVVRVRLDRGGKDVQPGMVVIAAEGVVGRIERVYGEYSDVLLAVDPKSAIDVRVIPAGARGIARGLGSDGFGCKLEEVLLEETVKPGDRVVTSGEAGAFPRDLDVGRVTRVTRPPVGMYQQVEIRPAVDFARLDEVLVVLAPPPAPDLDADSRRREPARGLSAHR
jgi:rod shape-determining protein MreC